MKKIMSLLLIVGLSIFNTGCVASWLSLGETESPCDKDTKSLGRCTGISDVMKNKKMYAKEYLKGAPQE